MEEGDAEGGKELPCAQHLSCATHFTSHPHLTDGETEVRGVKHFLWVAQQGENKSGILVQAYLARKLLFWKQPTLLPLWERWALHRVGFMCVGLV